MLQEGAHGCRQWSTGEVQACPQMWFAATCSKRVGAPGGKESTPEVGPSTLMEELMPTVRQVDGQAVIVAPTDPHFPPWSLVCASQDPPVPFPLCAHCPPSLGLAPYSCLLCLHPPQTHRFFSLLLAVCWAGVSSSRQGKWRGHVGTSGEVAMDAHSGRGDGHKVWL